MADKDKKPKAASVESSPRLDKDNSYSIYDSGPNPLDIARRLGLYTPDSVGESK